MNWKTVCVFVACVAALPAQTPPVTILEIDIENYVLYHDNGDASKLATSRAPITLAPDFNWVFRWGVSMADIVAVNGRPAKGFRVGRSYQPRYVTELTPARTIADISGNCATDMRWAILQPDGTPIGTIIAEGLGGTPPPPGAHSSTTAHDMAVVGGTGAFLGARGQAGRVRSAGGRSTTMAEDPAYRRINGGGKHTEIVHLIPMTWPEVLSLPTGPAIFHAADFSPVTPERPARAGGVLMMSVSGLGPVKPNLDPGKPFPPYDAAKPYVVNSPVEVTVNGKAAQVVNALGWPGLNNVYRVDFVVPDGTAAGVATLGLSVAWIKGPEVKIPVR
jgi:hypothetical protein